MLIGKEKLFLSKRVWAEDICTVHSVRSLARKPQGTKRVSGGSVFGSEDAQIFCWLSEVKV